MVVAPSQQRGFATVQQLHLQLSMIQEWIWELEQKASLVQLPDCHLAPIFTLGLMLPILWEFHTLILEILKPTQC